MPTGLIDMHLWEVLAFCAIAFAAAPLSLRLRLSAKVDLRISALSAVAFGSTLWLGPAYAPLPAFFAVLGMMTFGGVGSARFSQIVATCASLPIVAAASGWIYVLLGGVPGELPDAGALPPAVGALVAFALFDQATYKLLKWRGLKRVDLPEGSDHPGFGETIIAAAAGAGLAAYRGLLSPAALIPLPVVVLVAYVISLSIASRRSAGDFNKRADKNAAKEVESKSLNFIDPLTGLANERYMMMFLDQELSRSTRNNYPLSVIMLDLDDFEKLNNDFGAKACDRMMSEVASEIRSEVRDYDVVARYASDEFLVVLPEARGHDAFDTAERIRAIVSSYSPDWLGAEMEMSISGGVATFPDHGVTSDDLINSAHHALNRAKFSGKNRIFSCYELAKKAA